MVFGQVVAGQDVVTRIENAPADDKSRPLTDIVIGDCGEIVPEIRVEGAYHFVRSQISVARRL